MLFSPELVNDYGDDYGIRWGEFASSSVIVRVIVNRFSVFMLFTELLTEPLLPFRSTDINGNCVCCGRAGREVR